MQAMFAEVCPFRAPRLRQRWLVGEESDLPREGHCTDSKFKVQGSKGTPKMAVLYDLVISRISSEMCGLFLRKWGKRYEHSAPCEMDLLLQWVGLCLVFAPVFFSWCQITAYVNHFDPVEENLAASRGGERTYLVSIVLLLGSTYNMPLCDGDSGSGVGCAVHAGFMSVHRFFLFALALSAWFLLGYDDRQQARVWLISNSVHGCVTGLLLATQAVVMYVGTLTDGQLWLYSLVCLDMLFPFVGTLLPPASFLPADLSLWVQRCETLFKAGLTNVLLAAVAANFRHETTHSSARHMAGYCTPVYAYAFKVLYFDYTANICSVYVDPGSWKFLMWIFLHIPLMLSMIILGVTLSQELRDFQKASLAPILLPRAAFVALLSTAALEALMVRRTHQKSRVSRTLRITARMVCGVPLLLLPRDLDAYFMIWIPAFLLLFIAIMDRSMRTKRKQETIGIESVPQSFVTVASNQVVELA